MLYDKQKIVYNIANRGGNYPLLVGEKVVSKFTEV